MYVLEDYGSEYAVRGTGASQFSPIKLGDYQTAKRILFALNQAYRAGAESAREDIRSALGVRR